MEWRGYVIITTVIFNTFYLLLEAEAVVIKAPISQGGLKGEVRLSQERPAGDVTVQVSLHLTEGEHLEGLGWQLREFPVDYRIVNSNERCSTERLGKTVVDLGEKLGKLNLPDNTSAEFIIPGGYLNLSGWEGMWGRSLSLHGPRIACSSLMVEGEERIAEARFNTPLAGSVTFRWFGTQDLVDAVIFSDLYPVAGSPRDVTMHNWKIYVTDILETEADRARDDCDSLQLVFDPDARGTANCSRGQPFSCRAGDLDTRLGQLKIGGRHLVRDLGLPELPESSDGSSPRSLYLVVFETRHGDSILACARVRRVESKKALAVLQGSGVRMHLNLEQRSPYDLTFLKAHNLSVTNPRLLGREALWEYTIHELPARGGSKEVCDFAGPIFDPAKLAEDEMKIPGASHDQYAVGQLKLKHGPVNDLKDVWDSFLPLYGSSSIVHRALKISLDYGDESSVVCGTILPRIPLITAQAVFQYPVVGRVLFRQPAGQPWAETTVLVEYLVYADGNKNDTSELRWKIHENPAGSDFYNWTMRCISAGQTYNPFLVDTKPDTYDGACSVDRPGRCELGDLSTRHETLLAVGNKGRMIQRTRRLFTDTHLPLTGSGGIVGKSLVIYHDHGPVARGERLACTTLKWLNRQKAVVRDWFGNGDETPVRGRFEMIQLTEYDLTDVEVMLKGLDDNVGYHIHVASVEMHLSFPCEDSTVYGHWNPANIKASDSPPPAQGTPDQYEMGDLSGKFGTLANLTQISTTYNDSNLDLIGPLSVIGRSVVIHKRVNNRRWACSSVERGYSPSEARELRAIASFHHPGGYAYGYIRLTQLVYNDGSASNTAIEVKLRHPGKNDRNVTRNHNWAVFVNPVGQDAAVKSIDVRCVAGGYRWNPYFIQLADPFNDELYREQCGPDNPLRCYVGDLSGRLGPIDLGAQRQHFTDINLPLEGVHAALGKSIVIFNKDLGPEKYACANIEPDHDIIKYANIRKPPRFEVSKFLDRVRAVMGLPEWMLTVDNRKTKYLHDGTCIQLLLHFRGAQANALEQDFSRLLNSGSLPKASLFIPGALPNPNRPSALSYRQCGTRDPTEKHNTSGASINRVLLPIKYLIVVSFLLVYVK